MKMSGLRLTLRVVNAEGRGEVGVHALQLDMEKLGRDRGCSDE